MTPIQTFLSVCAAALALGLGFMTNWGQNLSSDEINLKNSASKFEATNVLPDFKLSAEQSAYAGISERPLLNPSRRPAPTQAVAQVAPEPPRPQIRRGLYQVLGISDYGDVKFAQVREAATRRIQSVKTGDALQEMSVKSIDSTKVVLAFQGETDEIELPRFTASGQVPAPPPIPLPLVQTAGVPSPILQPAGPPPSGMAIPRRSADLAAATSPLPVTPLGQMPTEIAPTAADSPPRERMTVRERLSRSAQPQ